MLDLFELAEKHDNKIISERIENQLVDTLTKAIDKKILEKLLQQF